ncbi:MAG: hypothetical protein D3923_09015 [Candidatus Electrothrix sp. AR3]|nr:hypothetical protein [Candidatus Electrothrix sp. AR3]
MILLKEYISLSSWIRDYIYIPLGGSRQKKKKHYAIVIMLTMSLCGLWHGAAWNFILWGVYHGLMILMYSLLGLSGKWRPTGKFRHLISFIVMFAVIQFGWLIFRAPSISWLADVLLNLVPTTSEMCIAATVIAAYSAFYLLPLGLLVVVKRYFASPLLHTPVYALFFLLIVLFHSETGQDFIYFQF